MWGEYGFNRPDEIPPDAPLSVKRFVMVVDMLTWAVFGLILGMAVMLAEGKNILTDLLQR